MGIIGIGHWFERLYEGMLRSDTIRLRHAASASGYERKRQQLEKIGIGERDYFRILGAEPVPAGFFDGLDIVHISDPNEFHAQQTLQSLSSGKVTITEKTFGVNREEFRSVTDYIRKSRAESKAYLHLHYVHKLLTVYLPSMLDAFVGSYGKIAASSATFFEAAPKDPAKRRLWLFAPGSGGLFMDWIHPFEVYYKGAQADSMDLSHVENYVMDKSYGTDHPTGVHAEVALAGKNFSAGAAAHVRIAKGIRPEYQKEAMRFIFEGGQCLDLSFLHSEVEFMTKQRGTWELRDRVNGRVIDSACPQGPTSSDILVNDIAVLCKGVNQGLTLGDIGAIFEPQWQYQERYGFGDAISSEEKVNGFIRDGLESSA